MLVDDDVSRNMLSPSSGDEVTRQGNKRAYIGHEERELKEGR
jgi:hypothetical protein